MDHKPAPDRDSLGCGFALALLCVLGFLAWNENASLKPRANVPAPAQAAPNEQTELLKKIEKNTRK